MTAEPPGTAPPETAPPETAPPGTAPAAGGPRAGGPGSRALPGWLAAVVTFVSSGAVLVLEIAGLRLIAPYVGITLQTNTAVIGFALAAIAVGAWAGGAVADRRDPRGLLVPLLVAGGALLVAVAPVVRFAGALLAGAAAGNVLLLAAVAVVVPVTLLSAVPPMVVALQLRSLDETGTVVGKLSGIGTLGGIAATFGTGFVLVALLPTTAILVGTGLVVVATGVVLWVALRRRAAVRLPAALLVTAVVGTGAAVLAPSPCEAETTYHCARVVADPGREGGRTLVLDTLRHSYVDLADPTYLQFGYVQAVASVTDTLGAPGEPLSALHVGGGGLTLPRYLADVRPGTTSRVLEVDAGVLALDRAELGLQTSPALQVDVGDARIGLADEPAATRDLVVGDAFGGLAVPWQLTTVEALQLVDRALTDDGVYAVNLIDHGPLSFLRAELATMQQVFPHVALLARAPVVAGDDGGNVVAVASRAPLDTEAVAAALAGRLLPWQVVAGADLDAFVGGAPVLTDDFAPVDQLLTPYG